jgi:hypothetical protein
MRTAMIVAGGVCLLGCATPERDPFDADADARIGAEVERACYSSTNGAAGAAQRIGDYAAFVTGDFNEKYLLVFSGCYGVLGPGGGPVFELRGDRCLYQGDPVKTFTAGTGVTGNCSILHIYEWDRD